MRYNAEDRSVCANCGRWRHEHYNRSGIFLADRLDPPCVEYDGRQPTDKELKALEKAETP